MADDASSVFDAICRREGFAREGSWANVPVAGGRRQRVGADVLDADGERVLRVHTVVGKAAVLNQPRLLAALRMNARFRYGAFAIHGEDLALIDTFPLHGAEPESMLASIRYLASKADDLERVLFGTDEQ